MLMMDEELRQEKNPVHMPDRFEDLTAEISEWRESKGLNERVMLGEKEYKVFSPGRVLDFGVNHKEMNGLAADFIIDNARGKMGAILATGGTFEDVYEEVCKRPKAGKLMRARGLYYPGLDEYWMPGKNPNNPGATYRKYYMDRLFIPLGIHPSRLLLPDAATDNPEEAVQQWQEEIEKRGPYGIALGGIGPDEEQDSKGNIVCEASPHWAFMPKGTLPDSEAMVASLDQATLRANKKYLSHPDQAPTHAMTQGAKVPLSARSRLILAKGDRKPKNVARVLGGSPSSDVPISLILLSPDTDIFLDGKAAAMIKHIIREVRVSL